MWKIYSNKSINNIFNLPLKEVLPYGTFPMGNWPLDLDSIFKDMIF